MDLIWFFSLVSLTRRRLPLDRGYERDEAVNPM